MVRDGTGYCQEHQADRKRGTFADPDRGTRHERGYGNAWSRLRLRILERDAGLCQPCLMSGQVKPATHVDHIKPKSAGGTDDEANLQAICVACHRAKTATESRRARR